MKVYQVGGCVRDRLLGLEPKDIDYVVVGATEAEMLAKGFTKVGAGFPVFLHPQTGDEWALARKERKTGVGYNGFDVVFDPSVTLQEDLSRRDLTINAMAIEVDEAGKIKESDLLGEGSYILIDPFGGQYDLDAHMLRHVSDAFAEDPVRVLRAARFAARYNFHVHPETMDLMKKVAHELNYVPQERIWAEFEKGLMESQPVRMFQVLYDCEALKVKALEPYRGVDEDMLRAVSPSDPIHVRFAAIASAFVKADYKWCCIPTDCARVAQAFNDVVMSLVDYQLLDHEKRVLLMMRLRAFNTDSTLLDDVLATWKLTSAKGISADMTVREIMFDVERARRVDTTAVAAGCANGKEVGEQILRARIAAISD